jgi:hypothetical protein
MKNLPIDKTLQSATKLKTPSTDVFPRILINLFPATDVTHKIHGTLEKDIRPVISVSFTKRQTAKVR